MGSSGIQTAGVNLTQPDTIAQGVPGALWTVSDGNWYQYFKATAALTAGQLCSISGSGDVAAGATTPAAGVRSPAGIVLVNMTTGQFGWLFRMGPSCNVLAAASCVLGVALYSTGVAGVVDDASTVGVISGLALTETITTARLAACQAGSFIMIN